MSYRLSGTDGDALVRFLRVPRSALRTAGSTDERPFEDPYPTGITELLQGKVPNLGKTDFPPGTLAIRGR